MYLAGNAFGSEGVRVKAKALKVWITRLFYCVNRSCQLDSANILTVCAVSLAHINVYGDWSNCVLIDRKFIFLLMSLLCLESFQAIAEDR